MSEPSRSPLARSTSGFRALWRYYSAVLGFGALLLLVVLPVAQGGQTPRGGGGGLIGTVMDTDKVGVAGLEVILRKGAGASIITASDEHGRFEFLNLDPGNYVLEVSGDGYQDAIDRSVDVKKGRPTTLTMQVAEASSVRVFYDTAPMVARPRSVTDRP